MHLSTHFIQQPTSAAMEMSPTEASNAFTSATTGTNNIYKIKKKRTFFSTRKWQQAPTTRNKHTSNEVKIIPDGLTTKNQQKALWAPQQQWHLRNQEQDCFHNTQPLTTNNNQEAQSWHQKISKSHRLSLKNSQTVYLVIVSRTDNLQQWLNSSTLAIRSPCRLTTNPMTVLASQQPDKLTTVTPLNMKILDKASNSGSTILSLLLYRQTQPFTVTVVHSSLQWIQIDRPVAFEKLIESSHSCIPRRTEYHCLTRFSFNFPARIANHIIPYLKNYYGLRQLKRPSGPIIQD